MATIPYADVIDRQLLPVDSQDIVTRARIVVAGDRAGDIAYVASNTTEDTVSEAIVEYAPWPITYVYEAPEHAIYGVERSFSLPSGVTPFLAPTDPLIPEPVVTGNMSNPGDPSAVRDGDPHTAAVHTGGLAGGRITYPFMPGVVGYRLQYTVETSVPPEAQAQVYPYARLLLSPREDGEGPYGRVRASSGRLVDTAEPIEMYMVVPPHANWLLINGAAEAPEGQFGEIAFITNPYIEDCTVTHFYPLILDESLLEDIARAQIRLPAQLPQRVTVRGYVPPDREHTITGWPGGDYTGAVAQHQYEMGRTIIDFEQAGSPAGLPAEAIEAARERQQAIQGTVQVANYNLMMGSRR